ncbi:hypothetical protein PT285_11065 [Lactobacillus sp. ESL0791]|nr:hypothetical protein [Lactobacillus sp. ESL0791]MDF7639941.1 hypothetical protein [Lactobacillus sp. ESL0791]
MTKAQTRRGKATKALLEAVKKLPVQEIKTAKEYNNWINDED